MTYQEILEGITRHRGMPVDAGDFDTLKIDLRRKTDEIEWALQALAEKLAAGDKE